MTYGEAWRLLGVLAGDVTSWTHAALAGWSYPWSREADVLASTYDAFVSVNSKRKQKPFPRPWPDQDRHERRTATPTMPAGERIAVLEAMRTGSLRQLVQTGVESY